MVVTEEFDKLYREVAEIKVELIKNNEYLQKLQNRPSEAVTANPVVAMIENSIPFWTREQVIKFEADLEADVIPTSSLVRILECIDLKIV